MRLLSQLNPRTRFRRDRSGTTIAETAVVLPVFFIILFGIFEFGHVYLTIHTLNAAARRAARLGISETSSTTAVKTLAKDIVGASMDKTKATVLVKNGSTFDAANVNASTINYSTLPDIELSTAERRQLFIVRISVPYSDVAILGPKWLGGVTVYGQCVMRKE